MTLSAKDWIFVSDAHFTGREPGPMEAFLRFLDSEENRIGHLVILGDLFDFFFGFKNCFSQEKSSVFIDYIPVFNKLQHFYQNGIQIIYFEGNHDFFLQPFFSEQFGMEIDVYPKGNEEWLEGRRGYIAHGDLSNPRQWTYRVFRKILKNPLTYRLLRLIGPHISRWAARRISRRANQKYYDQELDTPHEAFRTFAHQKFLEGFEVVILGHSHFPEAAEEWVGGKRCLYYNVGDWMVHRSYLRFSPPDRYELSRFDG